VLRHLPHGRFRQTLSVALTLCIAGVGVRWWACTRGLADGMRAFPYAADGLLSSFHHRLFVSEESSMLGTLKGISRWRRDSFRVVLTPAPCSAVECCGSLWLLAVPLLSWLLPSPTTLPLPLPPPTHARPAAPSVPRRRPCPCPSLSSPLLSTSACVSLL
jgi:hypothetical protein